ncbi:MAG: hydrogenase formation protein HypD [bacterium]
MKYIDEFRDPRHARMLLEEIRSLVDRPLNFMEVCGTHTVSISRSGMRDLLPPKLKLLSGPGCPVCVTPVGYVDAAIDLAGRSGVIVATFGDMMRVPGSGSSLWRERAEGADVRVVYSPLDALKIAEDNPGRRVVFLGVGFETTIPTVAVAVRMARERDIHNFFVLPAFKLIPPALLALLNSGEVRVDGFICPGHVSTIIGGRAYLFIPRDYGIPCVVAGFEPTDILQAVRMLLEQIRRRQPTVEIGYNRTVTEEGNRKAISMMEEVFEVSDSEWRGLGVIPGSGLEFRDDLRDFDAKVAFGINVGRGREPKGCRCGDVLKGVLAPPECPLFGGPCSPDRPVGACMVSSEGACAAYFHYRGVRPQINSNGHE